MSKTPIIHPHKSGTYITHTYVHTYLEVACPTLPRTGCLDRYPAISDQINLGIPTTHHIPTYIHMYRFCIVFISSLYTLSTPGRSCRLSEQLVKSHFIAPLYANAIAPLIVKSFMAFFFVIHGILLLLLLVLILLLVLLALFLSFALTLNTLPKLH